MGTYFHGNSEIQAGGGDGLQTLILMNPGYVGFSDAPPPPPQQQQPPGNNFIFLNSHAPGGTISFTHAPPSQSQQFVGIPLATTAPAPPSSQDAADVTALHGFIARPQYGMYAPPQIELAAAREVTRAQQGLSLSLSSQHPGFGNFRAEREVGPPPPSQQLITAGDEVRVSGGSPSPASGVSNGVNGVQSVLLGSKYLKAAQELLEEVVNVGGGVKGGGTESSKGGDGQAKNAGESSGAGTGDAQTGAEINGKRPTELTTAERQEIQMKKAKLVNMLDEVEQRYRHYNNQMQIVISWFEHSVGIGSAKTYTALALQTISKQFRCLKDAILGQIRAASKSLGEEDGLGGKIEGSSRLKFVDNQLRQQRALQQLGMIQHNAWRPQRGLPERSVSVLRAWLFEHFLHPYPKDSDKIMLAKQTGLTRNQVSNWFINARVRLWKPMVEEMYLEEVKEHEQNGSESKTCRGEANEDSTSHHQEKSPTGSDHLEKSNFTPNHSTLSNSPTGMSIRNQAASFNLIGPSEMESITQGSSPKRLRSAEMLHSPSSVPSMSIDTKPSDEQASMKFMNERQSREGFTLMGGGSTNFIGGFGSYQIGEIGRFSTEQFPTPYSGNAVSLTLGLPHNENLTHQPFLPTQEMHIGRGVEIGEANEFGGMATPTSAHSTSVYETFNLPNRKRFAAPLLPDFVA